MLIAVSIEGCQPVINPQFVIPELMQPLIAAAGRGEVLQSSIIDLVKMLGFDTFSLSYCAAPRLDPSQDRFIYSTLGAPWIDFYNRHGLLGADPRRFGIVEATMPLFWDQQTVRGYGAAADDFVDRLSEFDIYSGVVAAFHDVGQGTVVAVFNSAERTVNSLRAAMLRRRIGDIIAFAQTFFEVLFVPALGGRSARAQPHRTNPLSEREQQVLALAAGGLTTDVIAGRLGLKPGTVQHYMDTGRDKLGARNRQEGIARALRDGHIVIGNTHAA